MQHKMPDVLWRDFPKTATEFEARFATEEDGRAYWIEARWGGKPACARCESKRVCTIRDGTTFECADCRLCDSPELKLLRLWLHLRDDRKAGTIWRGSI
jgi:hypothetical protein